MIPDLGVSLSQLPRGSTDTARNAINPPMNRVNRVSKLRDRTENTPSTRESQIPRTTLSQTNAQPRRKVARRQCSVSAKMAAIKNAAMSSAMNTRCTARGTGDGDNPMSCGLSIPGT